MSAPACPLVRLLASLLAAPFRPSPLVQLYGNTHDLWSDYLPAGAVTFLLAALMLLPAPFFLIGTGSFEDVTAQAQRG